MSTNIDTNTKKRRTFTRSCRVKLTDRELQRYGADLAAAEREWQRVDNERRVAADEFKGRLATVDAKIDRYTTLIQDEHEYRVMDCYRVLDGTSVLTKRVDNDEVVDEKPADLTDLAHFRAQAKRDEGEEDDAAADDDKPTSAPAAEPVAPTKRKRKAKAPA